MVVRKRSFLRLEFNKSNPWEERSEVVFLLDNNIAIFAKYLYLDEYFATQSMLWY
jgi:hypothetical protein